MAGTGGRSSAAASMALPLLLMAVVVATVVPPVVAAGVQFRVGGSMGWRVPAGDAESYNQWAERNRFKIGDSLLFAYPAGRDSVLLVTKEGFDGCDTASPPAASLGADGNTVFTFNRSGPFFFISGAGDNCRKGEKMVVIVLADRSNRSSPTAAPPSTPPAAPGIGDSGAGAGDDAIAAAVGDAGESTATGAAGCRDRADHLATGRSGVAERSGDGDDGGGFLRRPRRLHRRLPSLKS
ncbi:unnamed protein product [Spirodela intermedia]|uniref:Phytocyanin domain-containing protein n=1 Tax=Spirodela intermedia TaxID=51605 RepID=A0A7I8IMS3_SPIIN|nr:unnamed protein product [Spirodela intermedia]CAA6658264.1 unnamed protein product [Spirodela intermedia]